MIERENPRELFHDRADFYDRLINQAQKIWHENELNLSDFLSVVRDIDDDEQSGRKIDEMHASHLASAQALEKVMQEGQLLTVENSTTGVTIGIERISPRQVRMQERRVGKFEKSSIQIVNNPELLIHFRNGELSFGLTGSAGLRVETPNAQRFVVAETFSDGFIEDNQGYRYGNRACVIAIGGQMFLGKQSKKTGSFSYIKSDDATMWHLSRGR